MPYGAAGGQTRQPIAVGVSLFGTASLDPDGRPMLYVGAGLMKKNARGTEVGYYYAVNLITNQVEYEFGGRDYFAFRSKWNAFDACPLIINDTLIQPSEGGIIYFVSLRTKYFTRSPGLMEMVPFSGSYLVRRETK